MSYSTELQLNNTDLSEVLNMINELPEEQPIPTLPELLPDLNNPASAENVQEGYEVIDEEGNVITGTHVEAALVDLLPDLSNPAVAAQILSGYDAVDDNGEVVTGVMANNGSVSQTLDCGGSYTIPAGYHDGTGKVTANSLASQTDGDATAAQILSGKTAYVDGAKVTGSMTDNGAVSKSITPSTSAQSYTIPAGYHNGSGIVSVAAAPTSLIDGDATAANVLSGKTFFVDSYTKKTGTMTNNGAVSKSITPSSSAQTYTIPAGYHNGSGKVTVAASTGYTVKTGTVTQGSSRGYISVSTGLSTVTGLTLYRSGDTGSVAAANGIIGGCSTISTDATTFKPSSSYSLSLRDADVSKTISGGTVTFEISAGNFYGTYTWVAWGT